MTRNIRPICVEGNLAYIPLTHGYEAIIDAEDVPLAKGRNWSASPIGRSVYAVANFRTGDIIKRFYLHRLITKAGDLFDVVPIEGFGLDNRKSNLRVVPKNSNSRNRRRRNDTKGFYTGVNPVGSRWQASITVAGKVRYLGLFNEPEEAYWAYCREVEKYNNFF